MDITTKLYALGVGLSLLAGILVWLTTSERFECEITERERPRSSTPMFVVHKAAKHRWVGGHHGLSIVR